MSFFLLSVFLIYPPGQGMTTHSVIAMQTKSKKGAKLELKNGKTITVDKFNFEGNTLISTEDLTRLTAPYLNRPLSQQDIEGMCYRIESIYHIQNEKDVNVYAPADGLKGNTLTIVVEEKK